MHKRIFDSHKCWDRHSVNGQVCKWKRKHRLDNINWICKFRSHFLLLNKNSYHNLQNIYFHISWIRRKRASVVVMVVKLQIVALIHVCVRQWKHVPRQSAFYVRKWNKNDQNNDFIQYSSPFFSPCPRARTKHTHFNNFFHFFLVFVPQLWKIKFAIFI